MKTWFLHLKKALSKELPEDRISQKKEKSDFKTLFKKIRPLFFQYWKKAFFGVLVIIATSLLSYPQPLINRFFVDNVLLGKQSNFFVWIVLLLVGIKILETLSGIFQRFYFTKLEQEIVIYLQHDILTKVLHSPKAFFDDKETGYLMSRISSDINGIRFFFSMILVNITTNALRFVGGFCLAFYLEWRIAVVSIFILPCMFFCVKYFSGKIHILSHQGFERNASISQRLQEILSSIHLIKSFASEKREIGGIVKELKESQTLALESAVLGSVAGLSISTLKELVRLFVLAIGGFLIIKGHWSLGSLLAFQAYLSYIFDPANFFAQTNFSFQNAMASLERISSFYEILPEENNDNGYKPERLKGKIEFRNVSFSYNGKEPVLENLSFIIEPGCHAAIVGPSGVGKTTLISLILGFYKPSKGEILFDDNLVSYYSLKALRERIGYVSQNTRLLSGSLMDNLRYGNLEASDKDVIEAAKASGIHDFIVNLPNSYNSYIGENGVNLSEGQKQRLSIARAIIKDPDILIMDEPTSSLDSILEKAIFESLPEVVRNKTLITIAHRLSTIQKSDKILVLKNKCLVAMGKHCALFGSNDFYKELVNNQQVLV